MTMHLDRAGKDAITFSGEPLEVLPWAPAPVTPQTPPAQPAVPSAVPAATRFARQLRDQIVAAHRAALQAQHALQDAVLSDIESRFGGSVAAGTALRTEHDVPSDAWYALDGQVPVAVLLEALRGARSPGGRAFDGSLVFHDELPQEGTELQVSVDRAGQSAACLAGGRLIAELTAARAGPSGQASTGSVPSESGPPAGAVRQKPLARTAKRELSGADVTLLAAGRVAEVFGAGHAQDGCNRSLRLPAGAMRMVDEFTEIDPRGGPSGLGSLSAVKHLAAGRPAGRIPLDSLIVEGAVQTLQTFLLFQGLHLVLADARFQPLTGREAQVAVWEEITESDTHLRYETRILDAGLVPRPYVVGDVTIHAGGRPIAAVQGLGVQIKEKPGTPVGPAAGGVVAGFLGRTNPRGERAQLNELHLAHMSKGDLGLAMGPEFDIYRSGGAPYIPNGDFLFLDRMMEWSGRRGRFDPGATMVTEYDSPADAWYYEADGAQAMPNAVLMETSLQSAVLLGHYTGAVLVFPEERLRFRNLDGHAEVLRDADLRGRTVVQRTTLLSHSAASGTILQNFGYELSADGVPFYSGESLFGYFTEDALVNQLGLDGGERVAPWIDRVGRPATARTVDPRRPAPGGPRPGSGRLLLVDELEFVEGGGDHRAGYLHGRRRIDPGDWYFTRHFHQDPVMPGSLGVEAILQGMQLAVVDAGLAGYLDRPRFTLPTGIPVTWRYRGQILRTDPELEFDVHIKEIRAEPGRLLVIGDANLWKSGLRIYELRDIAVAAVPQTGSAS